MRARPPSERGLAPGVEHPDAPGSPDAMVVEPSAARLAQRTPPPPAIAAAFAGRYAVERQIGEGGTATVWLARDPRTGSPVAIKVLDPDLALEIGAERFQREIARTRGLAHPHIVPLLDSGEVDGLLFYVMPHMDGGTLRQRLMREKQLPLADATATARTVAEALDHAHRAGLVHRDVKPENILYCEAGACLADFGIARAIERTLDEVSTSKGVVRGTIAYMSPEQALGERDYDGRSDLFSLGCVLYEMLAGIPAFIGATPEAVLAQRLVHRPRALRVYRPSASPALEAVVMRALEPAAADRFRTAGEMAAALRELELEPAAGAAGGWDGAARETAPARTPRRSLPATGEALLRRARSHPVWSATAGVALVGAIARMVWGGADGGAPPPAIALDTTRVLVIAGGEGATPGLRRLTEESLMRWRGVAVVEQRELADVVRRAPGEAPDGAAATRLARAAGAGRWLRVEPTRRGDSLAVRGVLVDARTDSTLATAAVRVAPDLAGAESALAALADSLLFPAGVPRPRYEERPGTRSRPARQAYAAAHRAIEAWDLARADSQLVLATGHDPGYAQAFLWLAQVRSWETRRTPRATLGWRVAAEQAARAGERLTERERFRAAAVLALADDDAAEACRTFERLTSADAGDFTAWFALSDCLLKDDIVVPDARSTTGWRFRSSYEAGLRAFERAFALQPMVHRPFGGDSFEHVQRVFMTSGNSIRSGRAMPPDTGSFLAYPSSRGDSLVFLPVPSARFADPRARARTDAVDVSLLRQRERLHRLAAAWRAAYPSSADALEGVVIALDLLGNAAALDSLRVARRMAVDADDALRLASLEVWLRVKYGSPSDLRSLRAARLLADSVLASHRPADRREAKLLSGLAALLGHATLAASHARVADARDVAPALAHTAPALLAFAAMGGPADSLRALETLVAATIRSLPNGPDRDAAHVEWLLRAAFLAAPDHEFATPPDPGASMRGALLAAWKSRDLARLQRLLAALREGRRSAGIRAFNLTTDGLYQEAAMLADLGDHRGALGWLAPTLDSLAFVPPGSLADVTYAGPLVRSMALRAELSAHAGDSADARRWAGEVAVLWDARGLPPQSIGRRTRSATR